MALIHKPVLVLNNSFEAINICAARRAFVLLMKGKATLEESDNQVLFSKNTFLPLVIRLLEYRRVPKNKRGLSRQNILARDMNTCQYCGKKYEPSKLTLDHVMPRSRGGGETWENLVTSCYKCNHKKADRTPEEAGMPLRSKPRAVTVHSHRHIKGSPKAHPVWDKYLYA